MIAKQVEVESMDNSEANDTKPRCTVMKHFTQPLLVKYKCVKLQFREILVVKGIVFFAKDLIICFSKIFWTIKGMHDDKSIFH